MIGKNWIVAVIVSALLAGAFSTILPAQNNRETTTQPSDIEQLSAKLNDDSVRVEERMEAARRLVSRQRDDANQVLLNALVNFASRNGQLAVARALANDAKPDEMFIVPLFALLRNDSALNEAAAAALGNYKENPEVLNRLLTLAGARNQPEGARVATVRAIGTFIEKPAAAGLMGFLINENESMPVRAAAADALVDLTGLRENGRDVQKWQAWWAESAPKSDAEWKLSLINDRASRLDQLQLRYSQLSGEVRKIIADLYPVLSDNQKTEMVLRCMRSNEPVVRSVGAQLVFEDTLNNRTIPSAVREQLRNMIGDSSVEVRMDVAQALRALNDASALKPLLAQIAQEPNADVRAALAKAIAPIRSLEAVAALRKMLHDPSNMAAEAAANAIKELGPQLREKDPALAAAVAGDLRDLLKQRSGTPGSLSLLQALVEAMVPLRQGILLPTFQDLLRDPDREIRRYALKGLGELHNPEAVDLVSGGLDDSDATVRLEAVDALGKIGSFAQAKALQRRMNPQEESDSSVREHAWLVFQSLLPSAPKEQLYLWADMFNATRDPTRRLVVLTTLEDKQAREKDEKGLAATWQNIAEAMNQLGRPADAAPYLRKALDYFNARQTEIVVTQRLMNELLRSLLMSKQYKEAVEFGEEMLRKDRAQQEIVGPTLRQEAGRLVNKKDADSLQAAMTLIGLAKRMNPPLDTRIVHDLEDIEAQVKKVAGQAPSTGPQSASTPRAFTSTVLFTRGH